MKVNKPVDREILTVGDLRIGELFTFASHMDETEPGVYVRTELGYVVVRAVIGAGVVWMPLKVGRECTSCMRSPVLRVQIDEITVLE